MPACLPACPPTNFSGGRVARRAAWASRGGALCLGSSRGKGGTRALGTRGAGQCNVGMLTGQEKRHRHTLTAQGHGQYVGRPVGRHGGQDRTGQVRTCCKAGREIGIVRSGQIVSSHPGRGHDKLRGRAHEAGWPVSSDGSWSACNSSEGLLRPWSMEPGWVASGGRGRRAGRRAIRDNVNQGRLACAQRMVGHALLRAI